MAGCSLVDTVADALIAWFDGHARDLPWRRATAGAWGVLVSEVMLQQTPVSRVEPIWYAWLARWPTPAALAADPPAEAIRAWGRLGYPRRALRLHECATAIVERHAGEVPADLDDLLALPGLGGAHRPPARSGTGVRPARYAGCCSPSCGTPPSRYPAPDLTWSGRKLSSAPGHWPAWSRTAWSARWTGTGTRLSATPWAITGRKDRARADRMILCLAPSFAGCAPVRIWPGRVVPARSRA